MSGLADPLSSRLNPPRSWWSALSPNTRVALLYVIIIGAMLTLGRAYQTDNIPVLLRATMWLLIVGLITAQSLFIQARLEPRITSIWLSSALALCLCIWPVTAELALLKYTPLLPKNHDPFLNFAWFMTAPVFLIGGGALMITKLFEPSASGSPDQPVVQDFADGDRDFSWSETTIRAVQAQEHYLRVHTDSGTHTVRGRMRDAVRHLAQHDGLQVHRSWWVARASVEKLQRRGRDHVLILKSGEQIPVARSRLASLRQQGWLDTG